MKENIALLASIYDAFSTVYDGFYACTAYNGDIRLQGKFNSEAVKLCIAMGYTQSLDGNGHIDFTAKDANSGTTINIVLT